MSGAPLTPGDRHLPHLPRIACILLAGSAVLLLLQGLSVIVYPAAAWPIAVGDRHLPPAPALVYFSRLIGAYLMLFGALMLLGVHRRSRYGPLLFLAPAYFLLTALHRWRAAVADSAPGLDAALPWRELLLAAVLAPAALLALHGARWLRTDPAASPGHPAGPRRMLLSAALIFLLGYHLSQSLPLILPSARVAAVIAELYGWQFGDLGRDELRVVWIYVTVMLTAVLPAALPALDRHRYAAVGRGFAALFATKALLMAVYAPALRQTYHVTAVRLTVQISTLIAICAVFALLLPRGRVAPEIP